MNNTDEIWLPVVGYESLYQVSRFGPEAQHQAIADRVKFGLPPLGGGT